MVHHDVYFDYNSEPDRKPMKFIELYRTQIQQRHGNALTLVNLKLFCSVHDCVIKKAKVRCV